MAKIVAAYVARNNLIPDAVQRNVLPSVWNVQHYVMQYKRSRFRPQQNTVYLSAVFWYYVGTVSTGGVWKLPIIIMLFMSCD